MAWAKIDRPFGAQLQFWRTTSLLMRMKRQERQMEALENTAAFHDVAETKGVSDV
jgi:hypothetical protein